MASVTEHKGPVPQSNNDDKASCMAITSAQSGSESHSSSDPPLHGGGPLGNTKLVDHVEPGPAFGISSKKRAHNWIFTWQCTLGKKNGGISTWTAGMAIPKIVPGEDPFPTWNEEKMRRLKFQLEAAPSTGKLHYQGYVSMLTAVSFKTVQKLLGTPGAHMIIINTKNPDWVSDNENYTGKAETRVAGPWMYGRLPSPGTRSDLQKIAKEIKEGTFDMDKFSEENTWLFMTYRRGIEDLIKRIGPGSKKREEQTYCILMCGPTGTGKTTFAKLAYPNAFIVTPLMSGWYDGYEGQDVVIFDEFAYNNKEKRWCSESEFNTIVGMLGIKVPVKGGFVNWKPKKIIITTNDNYLLWPDTMRRRINEIIPMTKQYKTVADNLEKNDKIAKLAEPFLEVPTEDHIDFKDIVDSEQERINKVEEMAALAEATGDVFVKATDESPYIEEKGDSKKPQAVVDLSKEDPAPSEMITRAYWEEVRENRKLKDDLNKMEASLAKMKTMEEEMAKMKKIIESLQTRQ